MGCGVRAAMDHHSVRLQLEIFYRYIPNRVTVGGGGVAEPLLGYFWVRLGTIFCLP